MVRERCSSNARRDAGSEASVQDAGYALSRDVRKIDKTIMDNFYKLVHTQPHVRLTAACSTFRILTALKKRNPATFNHHLNYCVERLVKGLASSRAMARKGYATLLLEILKRNQISTERLFTIAQQEFGNISNETSKDNLLGYYLLINIILDSNNFQKIKQKDTYIEKMYKTLRQLIDHKSYFDCPVSNLLCQRYEIFYELMLADIPAAAFGSDSRLTHTELLLIALCNKHKKISQFASLDSHDILKMSEALKNDKLKRRPLHPVWIEWSLTVLGHSPSLYKDYINTVVHPTFFRPNHNELAATGLELTAKLLSSVNFVEGIKCTLNDYIIRLLITSLRSRNSLHKHCIKFFSILSQTLKAEEDSYIVQQHIIYQLVRPPGSITFDQDSKTKCLSNLLNSFHGLSLHNFARYCIELLDNEMKMTNRERALPIVAKLLAHTISRPQFFAAKPLRKDFIKDMVKWLIVNSLFAAVDPLANEKEFWDLNCDAMPATLPLDQQTKNSLRSAYHTIMDCIVTSSNAEQRICTMGSFIDFCNQLIHHGAAVFYDHTGDITRTWQVYMVGLIEYRKICSAHGDPKILYPISSLYLLYGLQIVEHGLNCREQLADLYQAAQDAMKDDPSDGSWADILTDQIIAILSATECNSWIRKLCVSVFGSLLPHISETSIDLLCDVIKAPITSTCDDDDEENRDECSEMDAQDKPIDEDAEEKSNISSEAGDAMEAKDECLEEEDGKDAKGLDESPGEDEEIDFTDGSDSNDEDDSQSESELPAEEDNRTNEDNDKDSEAEDEEEYLNDEEMMKLDSVLVDMFKRNRVGAKKKRRDPSFKLRCLDLVKKVLAKKHNDTEVSKKILSAIIPVAARTRKFADTRPIAEKIDTMIAKMPGKTKLNIPSLMNGGRTTRNANSVASPDSAVDEEEQLVADAE